MNRLRLFVQQYRKPLAAITILIIISVLVWPGTQSSAYQTMPVELGPVTRDILASGTVQPRAVVKIGSELSGKVTRVLVSEGQHVREGQVLAEIDPTTFTARLREAEASYAAARADVVRAQAQAIRAERVRPVTERETARKRALFERGFVSAQALDAAESALANVRAEEQMAKADRARAESSLGQSRAAMAVTHADLERTRIRSPISGIVVVRKVEEGQTLASLLQSPDLFVVASDLRALRVEADVAEADIGNVRPGQSASFSVDAFPGREWHARVSHISVSGHETTNGGNSYKVFLDVLPNDQNVRLFPQMTALVRIRVAEVLAARRIPVSALLFRPHRTDEPKAAIRIVSREEATRLQQSNTQRPAPLDGDQVWRLDQDSDQPVPVKVRTGIRGEDFVEILGGDIKPGDRLVVSDRAVTGD